MIIEIKTQWRYTKEEAVNDLHKILQTIGKCKIATIKQLALTDHYEFHAIVEGEHKEIFKIK